MAARESEIQDLRTQLQASRWQLQDGIQHLGSQFNVPRRIRTKLAEHPLTWVAVSVAAGLVAAKVLPSLLRGTGKSWLRGLVPMALRAGAMLALPLLAPVKAMALSKAR